MYSAMRSKSILRAAAFGSLSKPTMGFLVPSSVNVPFVERSNVITISSRHQPQKRLFFSQNNQDDDWSTFKKSGSNLIKKGVDKIMSKVPFGKSEEERRAELVQKQRKEEITGGINSMLKDMPLPVRMMGRMVSPLLARAADEIAEQSRQAQDLLDEAQFRLVNDPVIAENLGQPVQVGMPFSQSSSTMSINGRTTARVQASFEVAGPYNSGIATMTSDNGEITTLTVNVNGRNISVGSRNWDNSYGNQNSRRDGDVIEAEIVDKKW